MYGACLPPQVYHNKETTVMNKSTINERRQDATKRLEELHTRFHSDEARSFDEALEILQEMQSLERELARLTDAENDFADQIADALRCNRFGCSL